MEYVIRINDSAGEGEPEPIILRLPPGGSDEIRLRVVNLGEPTNLAVKTDPSITRYVKPAKMNHYIVLEETIPLSVRMPETAEAVSGDLLLVTDITTKRIPVILEAEGIYKGESEDLDEDLIESHDDFSDGYDSEAGRSRSSSGKPSDGYGDEDYEDDRSDAGCYKSDQYYHHDSWTGAREGEGIDRYEPTPFYDMRTSNLIPFAMMLATTIVLMALTFHTRTLPLFPGALATSMMIVSLIIYATATMLKS